ncbi:MAG TPA: c-type cytochrome domain-containing protein, partial [Lacipirellulaceae bacterium]|nr:c-type cytochrome domain-containing protein [Lacipirellulaceae bacterium]
MPPDFARDVAPIFSKYCAGCHNNADREGDLSLESFAEIQQGGKKGTVVVSGRADASLMIRALNGEVEPAMPPPDNPHPTAKEIETLRAWIDAGAVGPTGTAVPFPEIKTPAIAPAAGVRPYLTSLAVSPDGKLLALGSYQRVELVDPMTKKVVATTIGLPGKVMSIAFSRDGARFVAGSGLTALIGAATICNATNGTIISQIKGHHDAIYRAEFSPDGQQLATCSYDRLVNLWNVADGKLIRSLTGHNGAVYDVAYSADGSLLASASADDTIKIWSAKTGERLDTLGQAEGEQHSVSFSSDSKFVVAAGSDRQLRLWTLLSREKPEINPLKLSRTAHNSAILKLAMSPDGTRVLTASEGRELVLWDSSTLTPIKRYEAQPDVVSGLAFAPGGKEFYIGCINGYWQKYSLPTLGEEQVASTSESASALLPAAVTPSEDVEALSKFAEQEPNNKATDANAIGTNAVVSGVIAAVDASGQPDVDLFRVHAQKGQKLVLEINAARSKSPLDSKLEVLTADGKAVPRVVLQAVRSSYYTFRGHDSTDLNDFRMHDAVEMEPNEYVYANGEVMKLWMLPRGPDSGFLVYPGIGANRFTYFGSTAITHALNEPIYIVQPHAPNETLIPNGLPVYTMYYENDDDGWRALGTDSRIAFTAPAEGDYLVRVSDVRG